MSKLIDLTGQRFGRLTVIERVEDYVTPSGQHKARWLCKCDCGNEKKVTATALKRGNTQSCGCYQDECRHNPNTERSAIHHGFGTRLYRIYRGMWQRCYDKNANHYSRYGGRGITICDEWLGKDGFIHFREWSINNGYSEELSIDRIDNEKGYSPDNCRWCTVKQQQNNRGCNVFLTFKGEKHTMAEWAEILDMNVHTINSRHRAGWSDDDILSKPIDKSKASKRRRGMNEEILLATTTLNNLKHHDYEVSDYKMCLKEGEVCQRALRHYIDTTEGVKVEATV